MQELLDKLIADAGLSSEQAQKAIGIMKEFVHAKVPPMFSAVVDGFFADKPSGTDDGLI